MKKILINASNLHVGGGIQVAASFIFEFSKMLEEFSNFDIYIYASTEVNKNLVLQGVNVKILNSYTVLDVNGLEALIPSVSRKFKGFDLIFTLFGPFYSLITAPVHIVGFAQAWIIYPNNDCYSMLSFVKRIKTKLIYWTKSHFFKLANELVVELDHVKHGVITQLGVSPDKVHVVHNCISSIYFYESKWQSLVINKFAGFIRLGYLGRNYIHKNTALFPMIVTELEQIHGIKSRFYVTFTEQEWAACTPEFRSVCINVGPLTVAQCPSFYQAIDGVVFPSLLECFSATPLEAMVMEKPLFASDRAFNRDICGPYAHYFDPLSATSAAQSIAKIFNLTAPNPDALRAARQHALQFSNSRKRAEKYLALLVSKVNQPHTPKKPSLV